MADLQFSKSKGTLKAFGKTYSVRSGIGGVYEPISDGTYTIPAKALMVGTEVNPPAYQNDKYKKSSYLDGNSFGWFLWIGVGNYGIHPDGNVPGTKGCIGLTAKDTRPLFNEFKSRFDKPLTLLVGQTLPGDKEDSKEDQSSTFPPPIDGCITGMFPGQYPAAPNWWNGL